MLSSQNGRHGLLCGWSNTARHLIGIRSVTAARLSGVVLRQVPAFVARCVDRSRVASCRLPLRGDESRNGDDWVPAVRHARRRGHHHPDYRLSTPTSSEETPRVGLVVRVKNNPQCGDLQEYGYTNMSGYLPIQSCVTRKTCEYVAGRDGRFSVSACISAGRAAEPIWERGPHSRPAHDDIALLDVWNSDCDSPSS